MSETICASFTFLMSVTYCFSRRIPTELRTQYTSPRIVFS
jgi:hypothetical protein